MAYNINDYEPVEVRLDAWWKAYPNGRVYTEVINQTETDITIRSFLFADRNDTYPMSTGIAQETKGSSPVNRSSWVENCETSSLGRSLANCNFAAKGKRPSREEMEKVERYSHDDHVEPEKLNLAKEAMEQVPGIETMEELKLFYTGAQSAGLLSIKVEGKTLNQAIGARKKELESVK